MGFIQQDFVVGAMVLLVGAASAVAQSGPPPKSLMVDVVISLAPAGAPVQLSIEAGHCERSFVSVGENRTSIEVCVQSSVDDRVKLSVTYEASSEVLACKLSSTLVIARGARTEFGGDGGPQRPRVVVAVK